MGCMSIGDLIRDLRTARGWSQGRLADELCKRGLAPLPSAANFVFVAIEQAANIAARMRDEGVAVRAFDKPAGLRISVGPWSVLEAALDALDEARR